MPLVMCDAMIVCPTWIAMTRDAISLLPTSGTGPDVFTQPRSVADRRRPIVTDGSDLKPAAQAAKDASAYRTATSVALVIEANGRLEKARPASLGREATPTGLAGGTHHVGQNLGQLDVHLHQRLMHALHPARLLGEQHLALTDHGAHHARRCRAATRRAAIPGSSAFATTGSRPRRSCARARNSSAAHGIAPRGTGARQPTPDFLPDAGVVDHASIIELDPQAAVPRFVSDGAQIPGADAFHVHG